MQCRRLVPIILAVILLSPTIGSAQSIPHPTDFFGFEIGTDGELARYPKVVEYLKHLADRSDRVRYQERGTTTNGHPYVLVTFSSAANLDRLDRLIDINHRLADPRGLAETDAIALAREGVPFYLLYATIHSTEVGNGQTVIQIAHRLASEDSPEIQEILDNTVVLLVPSQNPDGQVLVVDHWYETKGTGYERTYPDLYHRYTGHDNNRDWFMFTQTETRLAVDVHREFKPQVTHDMHQMGSTGARIFVPPFKDPYDPNIHPLLTEGQARIGTAMASALIAAGKKGVVYNEHYDLWTPARQYMLYHGQPRILTEIASARLADPLFNPAGEDQPLGAQESRWNFPVPYDKGVWRLGDIVDYGRIAVFAALEHMAKYRTRWLENFYRVHRDWVERDEAPYAFVVPADQRDPFETYELLQILHFGEIEIHRARTPFDAVGRRYPAGSWVVQLAQPYGSFAKTMLEKQVYPDLRYYPGGPPIPPYDVNRPHARAADGRRRRRDRRAGPCGPGSPRRDRPCPRRPCRRVLGGRTPSHRHRTPGFSPRLDCRRRAYRCFAPLTGSTHRMGSTWNRARGSCRLPMRRNACWSAPSRRPGSSSRPRTTHPRWTVIASKSLRGSACGELPTTCRRVG